MKKDAAYWEHVRKVLSQAPPPTAEQCEVISRAMLPKDWAFVPKAPQQLQAAA